MRNLVIASAAGFLFTVAQILIGRFIKPEKDRDNTGSRRDEILWIAVASGVFVLVVLLCLSVWDRRSSSTQSFYKTKIVDRQFHR
jgi:hypothetical protein